MVSGELMVETKCISMNRITGHFKGKILLCKISLSFLILLYECVEPSNTSWTKFTKISIPNKGSVGVCTSRLRPGIIKRNENGKNRKVTKKANWGDRNVSTPIAESKMRIDIEDSELRARTTPIAPDKMTLHPTQTKYCW